MERSVAVDISKKSYMKTLIFYDKSSDIDKIID